MSIEVMRQALEALDSDNPDIQLRAATALRAAIEQYDQTSLELCEECGWKAIILGDGCLVCARQKAKPVAYADQRIHGWPDCFVMEPDPPHTVPLYTAPRQWGGLTDEERAALLEQATYMDEEDCEHLLILAEAKLKAKNAA